MDNKYSIENFGPIINRSKSISEAIHNLGLTSINGGTYKIIRKYIKKYNLDVTHFDTIYKRKKTKTLEELLIENSPYKYNARIKELLYSNGIKERKCEECGQDENWRGKRMSLILDHINGVNNDYRLENIRILCPNCNSTTETFCRGIKPRKDKKEKRKSERLEKLEKRNNLIKEQIDKILNSKIDFSKRGWLNKVRDLLNKKLDLSWIKRYMPEFYKETCYKRRPNGTVPKREISHRHYLEKRNKELVEKVKDSNINFSKKGWIHTVARILGRSQRESYKWIEKFMPELRKFLKGGGGENKTEIEKLERKLRNILIQSNKQNKFERPSYEILISEVKNSNQKEVAKKYGVSSQLIGIWIKKYEKFNNITKELSRLKENQIK